MERGKSEGVHTAIYKFAMLLNTYYSSDDSFNEEHELASLQSDARALFQSDNSQWNTINEQDKKNEIPVVNILPEMRQEKGFLTAFYASKIQLEVDSEDFLMGIWQAGKSQ